MGKNEKLYQARLKKRWSQERAADEAGIARKTYIDLENGKRLPQIGTLDLLCQAFDATPHMLGYNEIGEFLLEPGAPTLPTLPEEPSEHVVVLSREYAEWIAQLLGLGDEERMTQIDEKKRNALLKILQAAGVVVTGTYLVDNEPWERIERAVTKPEELNQKTLTHFRDLMRISWEFSNGSELDVAERMLPQFLPRLLEVAYVQPEAAALASQGLQLKSVLSAHKFRLSEKVQLCRQAVEYARLAQDPSTLVAALIQLAVALRYAGQPVQALQAYQEAIISCDQTTPLLSARTHVEAAEAYASVGKQKEAYFYLQLGNEVFPAYPEQDPAFVYADCGRFVLTLYEIMMMNALAQPAQAWKAFDAFTQTGIATPERIRLEIVNHAGHAAILEGDLEKYACCLEDGVRNAVKLGSKKRFDEAFTFYREYVPASWKQHSVLKPIVEQYHLY